VSTLIPFPRRTDTARRRVVIDGVEYIYTERPGHEPHLRYTLPSGCSARLFGAAAVAHARACGVLPSVAA